MEATQKRQPLSAVRCARWSLLCIGLLVMLPPACADADIYMYVDREGTAHFSNTPTSANYKFYLKEKDDRGRSTNRTNPNRFDAIIEQAAKRYGIEAPLIKAVIKAESDFDPKALSRTGAKGLMQIMPETVAALQIKNPFDPEENVMGGTRYLKQMLAKFDDRIPLALAAYNAGPGAVTRYRRIPPYKETEVYVERVLTYYYLLKTG